VSVQKLSVWLPVTQDDLDDAAAFPKPYLTASGAIIWTSEPLDPLVHGLRWIYER